MGKFQEPRNLLAVNYTLRLRQMANKTVLWDITLGGGGSIPEVDGKIREFKEFADGLCSEFNGLEITTPQRIEMYEKEIKRLTQKVEYFKKQR